MKKYDELIAKALCVRSNAYAPYSEFFVGAALLCDDGKIFAGCNVENSSYGCTLCAERVAFTSAITNGKKDFCAIAIIARVMHCSCS